jgi:hypothetical protein
MPGLQSVPIRVTTDGLSRRIPSQSFIQRLSSTHLLVTWLVGGLSARTLYLLSGSNKCRRLPLSTVTLVSYTFNSNSPIKYTFVIFYICMPLCRGEWRETLRRVEEVRGNWHVADGRGYFDLSLIRRHILSTHKARLLVWPFEIWRCTLFLSAVIVFSHMKV